MMIPPYRAAQGLFPVGGGIAARGRQHLANPSVAARDPAVSPRMMGLDQPLGEAVGSAGAIQVCRPVISRSPPAPMRSVNALPLAVNPLWTMKGAVATSRWSNSVALFAVFAPQLAT